MRARLAAHVLHSRTDSREVTKAARAAGPASLTFFEKQVDPDGKLTEAERTRRAESARKAHFTRLALRSAQARSRN